MNNFYFQVSNNLLIDWKSSEEEKIFSEKYSSFYNYFKKHFILNKDNVDEDKKNNLFCEINNELIINQLKTYQERNNENEILFKINYDKNKFKIDPSFLISKFNFVNNDLLDIIVNEDFNEINKIIFKFIYFNNLNDKNLLKNNYFYLSKIYLLNNTNENTLQNIVQNNLILQIDNTLQINYKINELNLLNQFMLDFTKTDKTIKDFEKLCLLYKNKKDQFNFNLLTHFIFNEMKEETILLIEKLKFINLDEILNYKTLQKYINWSTNNNMEIIILQSCQKELKNFILNKINSTCFILSKQADFKIFFTNEMNRLSTIKINKITKLFYLANFLNIITYLKENKTLGIKSKEDIHLLEFNNEQKEIFNNNNTNHNNSKHNKKITFDRLEILICWFLIFQNGTLFDEISSERFVLFKLWKDFNKNVDEKESNNLFSKTLDNNRNVLLNSLRVQKVYNDENLNDENCKQFLNGFSENAKEFALQIINDGDYKNFYKVLSVWRLINNNNYSNDFKQFLLSIIELYFKLNKKGSALIKSFEFMNEINNLITNPSTRSLFSINKESFLNLILNESNIITLLYDNIDIRGKSLQTENQYHYNEMSLQNIQFITKMFNCQQLFYTKNNSVDILLNNLLSFFSSSIINENIHEEKELKYNCSFIFPNLNEKDDEFQLQSYLNEELKFTNILVQKQENNENNSFLKCHLFCNSNIKQIYQLISLSTNLWKLKYKSCYEGIKNLSERNYLVTLSIDNFANYMLELILNRNCSLDVKNIDMTDTQWTLCHNYLESLQSITDYCNIRSKEEKGIAFEALAFSKAFHTLFSSNTIDNYENLKYLILWGNLLVKENNEKQQFDICWFSFSEESIDLYLGEVKSGNGKAFDRLQEKFITLGFHYLKHLKILNQNNFKTEYINNLVNLEYLHINYITDTTFLQNLINLEYLNTDYLNNKDLINLQNLKVLELNGNDFDKVLNFTGDGFIYLINLESLEMGNIINFNEENLKYLLNLKYFDYLNKISGKYLKYLTKLEEALITLNENFKEKYLQNLLNLECLTIEGSNSFKGLYLNNLINLTYLQIPKTEVHDEHLNKLINLTHLNIKKCKNITGECLLNLNKLNFLDISNTDVREKYLFNLQELVVLKMNDCPKIILGMFLLNLNKLKQIDVSSCFSSIIDEELINLKTFIATKGTLFQYVKYMYNNEEEGDVNEGNSDDEENFNFVPLNKEFSNVMKEVYNNQFKEKEEQLQEQRKLIEELYNQLNELQKKK
ncbi:hypothetical protein ABK040_000344 [Willaertia magna]